MLRSVPPPALAGLIQFVRFGASGIVVTLFGVTTYWLLAGHAGLDAMAANLLAYLAALGLGYVLHSRFSFPGQSAGAARTGLRYVLASLFGLGLNSAWVWLLVVNFGGPPWLPIAPMVLVTPLVTFLIYRIWVFGETCALPNDELPRVRA